MKIFIYIVATFSISINGLLANMANVIEPNLNEYYENYKDIEHFSGISMAVSINGEPAESYYVGRIQYNKGSSVNEHTLFQIGSITKSFTAVRILQLVGQGKLNLNDNIGKYLPQYKKWGNFTIKQLLNMSSGLPNYSDSPSWNFLETENISRFWEKSDLIKFIYPKSEYNPPIKQGYYYTNTGYILAALIIEKVTHESFKKNIEQNVFKQLKLKSTYYPIPELNTKPEQQLMHGYGYNQYDNPGMVGMDMYQNNLSWAGAAGGIISNAKEIVKWVQALFMNDTLLNAQQRQQLTELISLQTGEPIDKTTENDPKGFGLGVVQAYSPDIGRFWYYEGETLGFRALYIYIPCNHITLAATINSATNSENDHFHILLQSTYFQLLKRFPQYQCQS